MAKLKVVVLGAGFGGLELASILSERLGDRLDLTLIDRNDHFFFGYSKLDVMFGRRNAADVKFPYRKFRKPGVTFRQEEITRIDPGGRKVITDGGSYHADVLVVALGADYDIPLTPGLAEAGNEFYSFRGAERVREVLPLFKGGEVIVGVTGFPFKCPPAPSEAALLLHEYLVRRGVRDRCRISLVLPFELPIPPSYGTSKALLGAFRKHGIHYIPEMMVHSLDPVKKMAELDDGTEMPFDLFLGIPEHRVPKVVEEAGLLFDGWVPVHPKDLKTEYSGVYAMGDVASTGTPKAGSFAMEGARTVAESIISEFDHTKFTGDFSGKGTCYVEFGGGMVGRADVDFFAKPVPSGTHNRPSKALANEKKSLETATTSRWFF